MGADFQKINVQVTLSPVRDWDGTFVEVNGVKRGIIRPDKYCGWVAERMGCYKTSDANCVFGRFAKKQDAIDAIVEATKDQPPYIVYPLKKEDVHANWTALGISS
jgi:hypothetical protein